MNEEIRVFLVSPSAHRKNWVMRYKDPVSGKVAEERSTGTTDRKEALKKVGEWQKELKDGRWCRPSRISWHDFRDRYEEEKLASLAANTQGAGATALNHLERVMDPQKLASLTSETISRFQAELRKEGKKKTSITAYLGHLRSALSWAVSMDLLPKMPNIEMPKQTKGAKLMRGRPITWEEFERMLKAVPEIRPRDPGLWQRYLMGLWLSGLRLEESLRLSWDADAEFTVDLSGRHPRFRIYAEAQKRARDEYFPMAPDFAEWLLQVPEDERQGPVFRLETLYDGEPMGPKRVSRTISRIGQAAGVVVDRTQKKVREKIRDPKTGKETGKTKLVEKEVIKFASAHDLRRAFGTRWAPKVKPAILQKLMRHSSIETTLRYYVAMDTDDVTDELYRAQFPQGGTQGGAASNWGECEKEANENTDGDEDRTSYHDGT